MNEGSILRILGQDLVHVLDRKSGLDHASETRGASCWQAYHMRCISRYTGQDRGLDESTTPLPTNFGLIPTSDLKT